jgi:alkylhydroperoxidase family enzyme
MALIKTVGPDEAEGAIKEVYDMMKEMAGMVPKPLQLMSASPKIFEGYVRTLQYYLAHPSLSPLLLACIRFVSASHCEYPYCIDLNKKFLTKMGGLSEEQVQQLFEDPTAVELPDKDRAMLSLVLKAIRTPEDVQQADVDRLRELGWSDSDIFDGVFHGASMVAAGIAFNAFKMGI